MRSKNHSGVSTWRPPRSKRWTAVDGSRMLAAYEASGLSKSEFARQHGVSVQKVDYWSRRLESPRQPASPAHDESTRFVPLEFDTLPRAEPDDRADACVTIVAPDGWRIEIPAELDSSRLPGLIAALRGV